MVHEVELPKISQSICLQGAKFEANMKNFIVLLQALIDNEAKPNSIINFCTDLYEYKQAAFRYENAPTRAIQRKRYEDYARHHSYVRDWLVTFGVDSTYRPEDFLEDLKAK